MATRMEEQERWDLRSFANFHLRDFPAQVPPRDAGPRCAQFVRAFAAWSEAPGDEAGIRQAEDQLAGALVFLQVLNHAAANPRREEDWPMVVVHGEPHRRRHAAIYEADLDSSREPHAWRDEVRLGPVDPIDVLGFRNDPPRMDRPFERLLRAAVIELQNAWGFIPSIVMPRAPRILTARVPVPAQSVQVGIDTATLGVCGRRHGTDVATSVEHAVDGSATVTIQGTSCPVVETNFALDAVAIDVSALPALPSAPVHGPLAGMPPQAGATHRFIGATSGPVDDVVIAWDASIPWLAPGLGVPSHVYTGACTLPGDSGAALVDGSDRVVGFARFTAPLAHPYSTQRSPNSGMAGWVWAETVFHCLSIQ